MSLPAATVAPAPFARVPGPILAAVAAAWGAAIAAEASGIAASLHHDSLLEGGLGVGPALLFFLVSWQVMIAAMMLPSSLPLVRMFAAASAGAPDRRSALGAFLGAYALVWSAFSLLAFGATPRCTRRSRRAPGSRDTTGRSRRRCCCSPGRSSSRR